MGGRLLLQRRDWIEFSKRLGTIYSKRNENGDCLSLERASKRGESSRESRAVGALRIHLLLIYKNIIMSIKTLQKRVGDIEYKVDIDYDDWAVSPREYRDGTYLCIRENRSYTFPNELDFDFEAFDDWEVLLPELKKWFWDKLFWLDCYEHSGITFSLAGEGMKCSFDTSSKCGFIIAESEKQARAEIEEYNQYINWECYWVDVSSRGIIEKGGNTFYSDWEAMDSMSCIGWDNLWAPSQFPFEEGEWEKFVSTY